MSIVVKDRVRETSSSVTTAGFFLAGAPLGFQPFSVIGDGNTTYYVAASASTGAWEVGQATYQSSENFLERIAIISSSSAGAPVLFPSGQADIFCTYPAEKAVYLDENEQLDLGGVTLLAQQLQIFEAVLAGQFEGDGYNLTHLNADNISSGVLGVANGGTGADNQPDALTNLAGVQATGYYLRSDGLITELSPLNAGDLVNVVALANGGTGAADQQTAINILTGEQISGYYLRSDGTDAILSTIQAEDVPTLNQNTTGTAANVSGVVATDHGGTGATTYTDGQLLIGNSTENTLTRANLSAGTGVAITNGAGAITVAVKISSTYASFVGTLTAFTGTLRWYPRTTITLTSVSVSVSTAPATTAVFNVRKNGVVLFSSSKPSITSGAHTSTPVSCSETLTASDYLTVDIETPGGAADAVLRIDYS